MTGEPFRSVARTMAEMGEVCPQCAHPFGRHEVQRGCLADVSGGDGERCACLVRPGQPTERCGCV
jgi:hypothetical protein